MRRLKSMKGMVMLVWGLLMIMPVLAFFYVIWNATTSTTLVTHLRSYADHMALAVAAHLPNPASSVVQAMQDEAPLSPYVVDASSVLYGHWDGTHFQSTSIATADSVKVSLRIHHVSFFSVGTWSDTVSFEQVAIAKHHGQSSAYLVA